MAKVPRRPSQQRLQKLQPELKELPVGKRVWRVYFRGGNHPITWSSFRFVGPAGGRFDHHVSGHGGQPTRQERGILYGASSIETCLAEVFQKTRRVDRWRSDPWLVAFDLEAAIVLLDLTGVFATRAGASMGLMSGPRPVGRNWARGFYEAYPMLHGLYYPSSMHGNAPAVALNERAELAGAIPHQPAFHRALGDPAMLTALRIAAIKVGYALD
ncbi:MAG: RES family NAD+ phosphorylase [Gammaproteobacteria bacterium]